MNLKTLIFSALRSLNRNRKRSFLTMLGIIIGITSVISIVAIGDAYKKDMVKDFTGDDEGKVIVEAVFKAKDEKNQALVQNYSKQIYTNEQKENLKQLPFVQSVEYKHDDGLFGAYIECNIRGNNINGSVKTTTDDVNGSIASGRNLSKEDNLLKRKVIVVPKELFGKDYKNVKDLVGAVATIKGISFEVVGISNSYEIEVPKDTYNKYFGEEETIQGLKITLSDKADLKESKMKIEKNLNSMNKSSFGGSYVVEDSKGLVDLLGGVLVSITTFIALVSGISLLIAGIGLMNMIYTSISERTKEIGIKRALGATKRDIRREFLVEGVVLTMIGGIIGYILGIIVAKVVAVFFKMSVTPTLFTALLAIAICVFIGLISSYIPARNAANSNTVDILK